MILYEGFVPFAFVASEIKTSFRELVRSLAERAFVSLEQVLNGILPRQLPLDSIASELAHPPSLLGMFEQPENFIGEIRDTIAVFVVAVERSFLGAVPALFQVEL